MPHWKKLSLTPGVEFQSIQTAIITCFPLYLIIPSYTKRCCLISESLTPCHCIQLFLSQVLRVLDISHLLNKLLKNQQKYLFIANIWNFHESHISHKIIIYLGIKKTDKEKEKRKTCSRTSSIPCPFFNWFTRYWKRPRNSIDGYFLHL